MATRGRRAALVQRLVAAAMDAGRMEALSRREVVCLEAEVIRELNAAPLDPQAGA